MEKREVVKICNPKQAQLYMKNGLECLRVYWSIDRIVYEFDKEKSNPLYTLWLKHELK